MKLMVYERTKIMGLWITLMILYMYCDIFSFHRIDYVETMTANMMGPFEVTQATLAVFGALMIIPSLMIPACLFLKEKAVKGASIIVGALYTLVNIGNLIGETYVYYWVFGIIEAALTIAIIVYAIKWKEGVEQK